jgi:hypothetical protein
MSTKKIEMNSILDSATKKKVGDGIPLLGYIGQSNNENLVVLYKDVLTPCDTMEIASEDIVHLIQAPNKILPFEGVIIWVKKDAPITYKRTLSTTPNDIVAKRQAGRLLVSVTGKFASDDCSSHCNGTCEHCQSHCTKGVALINGF